MKKILIITTALLSISLVGCNSAKPLTNDQNSPKANQVNQQPAQTERLTYRNTEYGFELTFPSTWKGHTTPSAEGINEKGTPDEYKEFNFKSEGEDGFGIGVYTKAQWKILDELPVSHGDYMGEKGKYVFVTFRPQDFDPEENITKTETRQKEIDAIIKSFKAL